MLCPDGSTPDANGKCHSTSTSSLSPLTTTKINKQVLIQMLVLILSNIAQKTMLVVDHVILKQVEKMLC
jgi:hypothetical protein